MSHKFFANTSCEFYPCHKMQEQNCLFCFCPLYHLEICPGTPVELPDGRKDCGGCEYPHKAENYDKIIWRLMNE